MTKTRIFALTVTAITLIAANCTTLVAQAPQPASKSRTVGLTIELEKAQYDIGEKPWVILTMKNTSRQQYCLSTSPDLFRIHVEGENGEPPQTDWHRHLHGDVRPGDLPDPPETPPTCRPIVPKSSDFEGFNLLMYYKLTKPGKYSVYLEVLDPSGPQDASGLWLRTNTVPFEILPAKP
jgi:hypothetical protein